jgi:hypothetical protein
MAFDFPLDMDRPLAERGIDGKRAIDRRRRRLRARDDLDERHQMGWIERMSDNAALGVAAVGLQVADQQARRTRCNDDRARRGGVDLTQQPAFERRVLGGIFLHEVCVGNGRFGRRVKAEAVLRGDFRERSWAAEADERRPGVGNKPAKAILGMRRRIAGGNRQASRQEKRGPARTDGTRSDHRNAVNLASYHFISLLLRTARAFRGSVLHRRAGRPLLHLPRAAVLCSLSCGASEFNRACSVARSPARFFPRSGPYIHICRSYSGKFSQLLYHSVSPILRCR